MRGDIVGEGRDCVVLDHGPGWVLRRPRVPRSLEREAAVLRWADRQGYPVPSVGEDHPAGLVMERVDGPTMLADVRAHPDRLVEHLRTLARLHADLQALPAPPDLPRRYGAGDVVVHGDLHPDNVILTTSGPVVVDWTNAALGGPGVDPAVVWLLLACTTPPGGVEVGATVDVWLDAIAEHRLLEPARTCLPLVLEDRRHDRHLTAEEIAAMDRLVAGESG